MPNDSSSFTILLIDDDPSMIGFLSLLLSDKGNVITARDGEEGINLAQSARPDLILLDVTMAGIDGFEVCRRLKASQITTAIPILFVTAGDDEEFEVQALELGAVDFITKPLRPAIVRARVDTQLALRQHIVMMEELVHVDGLTKLFNRRFFDDRLETEVARHRRQKQSMAVALADVDHFKRYNDGLGHQCGDDCLRQIAQRLASSARRPGEVVARYGGEEFVIIIPNTLPSEAIRYGEWLCKRISDLKIPHPNSVTEFVTISIGIVACTPLAHRTPRQLLELADQALYAAKDAGRDQCIVLEQDPDDS